MAEQDRYGSHLGANPTHDKSHIPSVPQPQGSGAEQDRFGGWFGGGKGPAAAKEAADKLPQTSGAEQDRYGGWFGGNKAPPTPPSASAISDKLPQTSGAEQDRYGGWLGGDKGTAAAKEVSGRMPQTSGAEQDRYNGWFGGDRGSAVAHDISERLPKASGAEQDRYEGWFGGDRGAAAAHRLSERLPQTSGAEQDRYGRWFGGKDVPVSEVGDRLPRASGAEQDRFGSHFSSPFHHHHPSNHPIAINSTAIGLLQSAVLPSFGFHAGLSVVAYGVSRYADRVEGKDWLWPSAQVANAWWSAVGSRVLYDGLTPSQAFSALSYPQRTLLAGVSAWGLRLFYRVASRSLRRGGDDPRYVEEKKSRAAGDGYTKNKFWNGAFFESFLPEAVVQTLVTLPFTLPFRATAESVAASPVLSGDVATFVYGAAVFLFGAGFALEVLADVQLEAHGRAKDADLDLNREGVWSIVRHPK